jgi:hypothetical protein
MSVAETLVTAGAGVVVGLLPFGYTVRKDRRERREREASDKRRELEHEQERLTAAATRYFDLLGKTMALLEAVLVDADNADELLRDATEASSELQGHAQADLLVTFGASSPAVWADRACRRLIREGLTMATEARSQRQSGQEARQTWYALRQLTQAEMDPGHGPRELVRWATEAAIQRWPEPLTSFEDEWQYVARAVSSRVSLELPAELVAAPQSHA